MRRRENSAAKYRQRKSIFAVQIFYFFLFVASSTKSYDRIDFFLIFILIPEFFLVLKIFAYLL